MTSTEMVTTFKIRTDLYETPMGTFECSELARQACIKNDMDPRAVTTHKVKMATVQSLLKAINDYCGKLAEEYAFSLDMDLIPETGYRAKPGVPPSLVPQHYRYLIAFAVEGSSEGYYVHVGALIDGEARNSSRQFQQFGIAKTNSADSAYELAKETQRFLCATVWN